MQMNWLISVIRGTRRRKSYLLMQRYRITDGTVRLVQSTVIGANVRMPTGVLGGVADGAASS